MSEITKLLNIVSNFVGKNDSGDSANNHASEPSIWSNQQQNTSSMQPIEEENSIGNIINSIIAMIIQPIMSLLGIEKSSQESGRTGESPSNEESPCCDVSPCDDKTQNHQKSPHWNTIPNYGRPSNNKGNNEVSPGNAPNLNGIPANGKNIMNTQVANGVSGKVANLKNEFDHTYSHKAGMENAGDKGAKDGMYSEYISCESLVDMYKATGDTSCIDKACELCNAYIDAGEDFDGRGYKDWHAKALHGGINHDHYEWRSADGVAMVCNQLMTDPKLKQKYASQADKFSHFIDHDVWEKWSNMTGRCGNISTKVPSEQHFVSRIGKIALNMYNCTGDPKYKNSLDKHVPKLENAISKNGDIQSDNGHSADTADFIAQCYKAGLYFTQNDIQKLVSACKKRGCPDGWVGLAQYDPGLRSSYEHRHTDKRARANILGNLAAMEAGVY